MNRWLMGLGLMLAAAWGVAEARAGGLAHVMKAQAPQRVQAGQRIVADVSLRLAEPAPAESLRPLFWLAPKGRADAGFEVNHRQLTPWEWRGPWQTGQSLNVAAVVDVPADFPLGEAELLFRVAYQKKGGAWEYVAIQGASGRPAGEVLRLPVRVVKAQPLEQERAVEAPLVVRRIDAPTLDGQVTEAAWQSAAQVEAFVDNQGGSAPQASTRAYIGRDEDHLYVAFVCQEPQMDRVVSQEAGLHGDGIWNNDCVELFIAPDPGGPGYLHFIVDVAGQQYDALGEDNWGFNPPWQAAVSREAQSWSVEMAIPWASLGVEPPGSGALWRANLCRERKAQDELSAWRPTHGSFASPGAFGAWVFDSLADHLLGLSAELQPPAEDWPAELRPQAQRWRAEMEAWRKQVKSIRGAMDEQAFAAHHLRLAQLRRDLDKLRFAAAKAMGQRFVVTQALPYEAFDGQASPDAAPLGPIELTLLRGEWQDLAFNITNLSDEPLVLRCTVRYGQDDELDYARLGLPGLTVLWQQAIPVAAADGRIVYDAIIPQSAGLVHIPPGRTAQAWLSIHADEQAPSQAQGRIEIQPIDMQGGEPVQAPIAVMTLPVQLTQDPPIHCFTWNFAGEPIESQPRWWRAHLIDLVEHGVDVCMISSLNHLPRMRASSDGTMPTDLDFAKLDRLLEATSGLFRLYWLNLDIFEKARLRDDLIGLPFGTPAYERAFKEWFSQVLAHFQSRGVGTDKLLVNPYDESVSEECRLLARWVKEVDPSVRIVIDSSTPDVEVAQQMDALTDVWVPHHRQFFPAAMQPFHELIRSSGKPIWAYYYSEGSNDKAQDPTRHYLAKFWWAFANDVTGLGYWAQQYYGDPWYRQGWRSSYDTALWYPMQESVAPSRRWQAWRQGWQDYLLLSLVRDRLRQKGDEAQLAELDRRVQAVVDFPGDSARMQAVRAWLKRQIAATP
ncbi:MAG TPA: carbohydrate-binding family 9-like protein [Phycisphaeraceae bacterium]